MNPLVRVCGLALIAAAGVAIGRMSAPLPAGRFEVVASAGKAPYVVKMDTTSGRSWVLTDESVAGVQAMGWTELKDSQVAFDAAMRVANALKEPERKKDIFDTLPDLPPDGHLQDDIRAR